MTKFWLKMAENGRMAELWLQVADNGWTTPTIQSLPAKFSHVQVENGWTLSLKWLAKLTFSLFSPNSSMFSHFDWKGHEFCLKTAEFWLKVAEALPKTQPAQPLCQKKALVLPETGAEFDWRCFYFSLFQPNLSRHQPTSAIFRVRMAEVGWRRLNFGWKRLKLAHFGQNAAVCQPLSGHVQAFWLKKAEFAWKWMKWLSTAEFWLKMAAYWPKFSRNSTILSQLQPFSAYSQPTSAIFRLKMAEFWLKMDELRPIFDHFQPLSGTQWASGSHTNVSQIRANRFARIDSQNKARFWSAWPDSCESRLLSDSHSNSRDSGSLQKNSKRESIRANRPTKFRQTSAIFSQSAWKWLNLAEYGWMLGCQEEDEFGWQLWVGLRLVAEGLNHTAKKDSHSQPNPFWPGGYGCLEAKISHFHFLAWCLLKQSLKGQRFFCDNIPHKKSSLIFQNVPKIKQTCKCLWVLFGGGFLSDWWKTPHMN